MTSAAYAELQFFYAYVADPVHGDINGDHALTHLVAPLAAQLAEAGLASSTEFMRYSIKGYHVRVKFRNGAPLALPAIATRVDAAVAAYRLAHPERIGQAGELGIYARQLHERAGKQIMLSTPGSYTFATKEEEPGLFEDDATHLRYVELTNASCKTLLSLLAAGANYNLRKTFVRLFLADILLGSGLSTEELYYSLYFAQLQWRKFFALSDEANARCTNNYLLSKGKYHRFLHSKDGVGGSVAALPAALGPLYRDGVAQAAPLFSALLLRNEAGKLTNHSALRILSLIHLTHNRVGLDIEQEILFAELLCGYWQPMLRQEVVDGVHLWAGQNIEVYLERSGNTVVGS